MDVDWYLSNRSGFGPDNAPAVFVDVAALDWTIRTVENDEVVALVQFMGAPFSLLGVPPSDGLTLRALQDPNFSEDVWIELRDENDALVLYAGTSRGGAVGLSLGIGGSGDQLVEAERLKERDEHCERGTETHEPAVLTSEIAPGIPLRDGEFANGYYNGHDYLVSNIEAYVYYETSACKFPCTNDDKDEFYSRAVVARIRPP